MTKWNMSRMVIALATSEGWPLLHLDVKTTFLHGNLTKPIYMHILPRFYDESKKGLVCLLCKSLYGLWQSPCM